MKTPAVFLLITLILSPSLSGASEADPFTQLEQVVFKDPNSKKIYFYYPVLFFEKYAQDAGCPIVRPKTANEIFLRMKKRNEQLINQNSQLAQTFGIEGILYPDTSEEKGAKLSRDMMSYPRAPSSDLLVAIIPKADLDVSKEDLTGYTKRAGTHFYAVYKTSSYDALTATQKTGFNLLVTAVLQGFDTYLQAYLDQAKHRRGEGPAPAVNPCAHSNNDPPEQPARPAKPTQSLQMQNGGGVIVSGSSNGIFAPGLTLEIERSPRRYGPYHLVAATSFPGSYYDQPNYAESNTFFYRTQVCNGDVCSGFEPPVLAVAPSPLYVQVQGSAQGASPRIKVLVSGNVRWETTPFDPSNLGGVSVDVGDVNGDGRADIVAGAGVGLPPEVKVYDGASGALRYSFYAYDYNFRGGINVAFGDVNGDGSDDIITGAKAGGGPHIRAFDGETLGEIVGFFAYAAAFTGGVNVGSGDVDGDGKADIITGAGAGGGPHVRVIDFRKSVITEYFAYAAGFTGGVNVAAANVTGDERCEVLTGAGAGGGPHVTVRRGNVNSPISGFFAFDASFSGGVRVAGGGFNSSGYELIHVSKQSLGNDAFITGGIFGGVLSWLPYFNAPAVGASIGVGTLVP